MTGKYAKTMLNLCVDFCSLRTVLFISYIISFAPLTASSSPATGTSNKAFELLKKDETLRRIPSFRVTAQMKVFQLENTQKNLKSEKSFYFARKLKDSQRYQSLTRFFYPKEILNQSILFNENDAGKNDILMYLPYYHSVRRVETKQQSESFMGSDLSYSDLTTPHPEDFDLEMKDIAKCSDFLKSKHSIEFQQDELLKHPENCHVLISTPKTVDLRDRIGAYQIEHWVSEKTGLTLVNVFFDVNSKPFKTIYFTEWHEVDDSHWFSDHIFVHRIQKKSMTEIVFKEISTSKKFQNNFFTESFLKNETRF